MKISDQLRQIADTLDAEGGVAETGPFYEPGHVLLETGPDYPTFDPPKGGGICVADFWVRGRVGCMKGAHFEDYSTGSMLIYKIGDLPHLFTCSTRELGPPGATGSQLMASVADAGWMNGRNYRPRNPPGQNQADFIACGRPSGNQYGQYTATGDFKVDFGPFGPGPT